MLFLNQADVVYCIAYSLVLLNTDIHFADNAPSKRMTKAQFVRNTMDILQVHLIKPAKLQAVAPTTQAWREIAPLSIIGRQLSNVEPLHVSDKPITSGNTPQHNRVTDVDKEQLQDAIGLTDSKLEALLRDMYNSLRKAPLPYSNDLASQRRNDGVYENLRRSSSIWSASSARSGSSAFYEKDESTSDHSSRARHQNKLGRLLRSDSGCRWSGHAGTISRLSRNSDSSLVSPWNVSMH